MGNYLITYADLMLFVKWQSVIVCLPFAFRFLERAVDVLFDGFATRLRLARSKNPRFVLDSYRWWVTSRRERALEDRRYRHYEP